MRGCLKILILNIFLILATPLLAQNTVPTADQLRAILSSGNPEPIKSYGKAAVDPLLDIYESGDEETKTNVASALYMLSEKSERGRELLMKDVHTTNQSLRLQVQWALGRLSSDESVVKTLLDNMRNDPNPLFRDKAACALAHDQIHLTEKQNVMLLEGLIAALSDDKDDVRNIAILALQIRTGQTKGYSPNSPSFLRKIAIARWNSWLEEYKQNIQ